MLYIRTNYHKELTRKLHTRHGLSKTRPWVIWCDMRLRCNNPSNNRYSIYGGRGIKVCDKWLTFENFWEDMGGDYANNLSIERINNNKGYYKENCRWATVKDQANNRRSNHLITYNGITKTLQKWSELTGIKSATIRCRLGRYKWSVKDSLTKGAFYA